MNTFRAGLIVTVAAMGLAGMGYAAQAPDLGVPLSREQVAAIDFTVLTDGSGLPDGRGNALIGETVYQRHCLSCHGLEGTNGLNDRLAGGHDTLDTSAPVKTIGSYWPYATTVFDYIRRAMPYNAPGVLSNDEMYAVTAYLLFINGVIAKDEEMNADALPRVNLPNRNGFVWAVPEK